MMKLLRISRLQHLPTRMNNFNYFIFVFICCSTLISGQTVTTRTSAVLNISIHFYLNPEMRDNAGVRLKAQECKLRFYLGVNKESDLLKESSKRFQLDNAGTIFPDYNYCLKVPAQLMGHNALFTLQIHTKSGSEIDIFNKYIHLVAPNINEHENLFPARKKQPDDRNLKSRLAISYALLCESGLCGKMCNQTCQICIPENSDKGHYECDSEGNRLCLPGYSDPSTNCTQESICFDNPCLNGGTCTEMEDGFWCDCPPDFDGFICEDCTKCKNDGICHIDNQNITCECTMHYDGERCENKVSPCAKFNNPCQNGGTCFDTDDGYLCNCAIGYDGIDCKESAGCDNIENACVHGTCVNKLGKFTCNCEPGMEGKLCEADIDECKNNPCHETEECINTIGSYHCLGYTYECPLTCLNGGVCVSEDSKYRCDCPTGFVGSNCEMVDKYWEHPRFDMDHSDYLWSHGILLKPSKLVLIIGLIILTTIWSLILQSVCM